MSKVWRSVIGWSALRIFHTVMMDTIGHEKTVTILSCSICGMMIEHRNCGLHEQWHDDLLNDVYRASVGPDGKVVES